MYLCKLNRGHFASSPFQLAWFSFFLPNCSELPIICTRMLNIAFLFILGEKFLVFTIEDDVSCGFLMYGLYYFKVVSFYS